VIWSFLIALSVDVNMTISYVLKCNIFNRLLISLQMPLKHNTIYIDLIINIAGDDESILFSTFRNEFNSHSKYIRNCSEKISKLLKNTP
jgi:hypothetical protein